MFKLLGACLVVVSVLMLITALRHNTEVPPGMQSGSGPFILSGVVMVIGILLFV